MVPTRTKSMAMHLPCEGNASFDRKILPCEVESRPPVVMATNDKHCQTFAGEKIEWASHGRAEYAMLYDETVEVDAQEIESPEEDEEVVKAAMSKFNPPVRHTARHDFDSDSDSESEIEDILDNATGEDVSPDRKSQKPFELSSKPEELPKQSSRDSTDRLTDRHSDRNTDRHSDRITDRHSDRLTDRPSERQSDRHSERHTDKFERRAMSAKKRAELESSNSDTDSAEIELDRPDPTAANPRKKTAGVVIPAEGAYDPKNFQDLKLPTDIENLFQYIMKYTPQKIDIEFKLQPFVPEYVPAVGDIDAFIKVGTPACNVRGQPIAEHVLEHVDNLGLTVLDEPASEQSDSALLHLQLRAMSKTNSAKSTVLTKKIENAEKNSKAIDRWIKDVSELHLSKPAPTVNYNSKMPDIDTLMEEWPEHVEDALNAAGFPPPTLDCSLAQYVDIVCGVFDIPVGGGTLNDRIQALHLLFSLYSAVKNNQLFEERQGKESV